MEATKTVMNAKISELKNNKLALIHLRFRDTTIKCKDHDDDRKLFLNILENLIKAILEMESLNIESAMLKVAFNEKFNKEMDNLESLQTSLKERNMI